MTLSIQPLTAAQVRQMLAWQYAGPYAIYNMDGEDPAEANQFIGDPANGYFAIADETGDLIGFCNFGHDARVPGGDYGEEALDIGMGLRPDLTGQGRGAAYAAAVFEFARRNFPHSLHRVTIAEFNRRAQRLCEHFGFQVGELFAHARDGRPFVIMTRTIAARHEEPADSSGTRD
jgi:RimJ/RimL family protein N-acetyltransferase